MDERIMEPNGQFPMDKLVLTTPMFIHSGNYFIKYLMNNAPLYIQPPKCTTKQGFIKGGKRMYCDLLFTNENDTFIQWLEDLEAYSQKYIYEHRAQWFESNLEMHDIENSFTSPVKVYKSGKYYIVRTIVPTRLGKCTLKIFDENERDVPMEEIRDGTQVHTIWEVLGIKCSTRVFQIDIEIKQMMVVQPDNLFEKCIFTKKVPGTAPDLAPTAPDLASTVAPLLAEETPEVKDTDVAPEEPDTLDQESPQQPPFPMDVYDPAPEPAIDGPEEEPEEGPDEEAGTEEPFYQTLDTDVASADILHSDPAPRHLDIQGAELEMVDLHVREDQEPSEFKLKTRHDVYYDIYQEAKKKAEDARNLAISAYLEAKRIKELYMIQEPLDFMDGISELA